MTDPFLGQPDAIAAGRVTYAGKCYVRRHSSGARGPNLFATKLSDQRFPETVIQGRKGTQMPAFGLRCRRRLDRKRPSVCQFCGGNERPDGWFLPLSAVKLSLILQRSTEVAAELDKSKEGIATRANFVEDPAVLTSWFGTNRQLISTGLAKGA